MIRKFLKRSIPFLVAALILIGAVAVPVQAAFWADSDYYYSDEFEQYHSFVDFDVEIADSYGDMVNFTFSGTMSSDEWLGDQMIYDVGSSDDMVDCSMQIKMKTDVSEHFRLMIYDSIFGKQMYYQHSYDSIIRDYKSVSDIEFVPTEFTYTFEDFVIPLNMCPYGSTRFRLYVPEGWTYVVSYDYYFVYPQVYDVHYTSNIISEKHEQWIRKTGKGEHCELVREDDYHLMVDQGVSDDALVLITNAMIYLMAPADYDGSRIDHYFYAGYSQKKLPVSSFFINNDIDFSNVVYVDKIVEVPVFDIGITNFLTTGVGGFLDADIFGTFSIGDLLSILISVFFVVLLLKVLR